MTSSKHSLNGFIFTQVRYCCQIQILFQIILIDIAGESSLSRRLLWDCKLWRVHIGTLLLAINCSACHLCGP